MIWITLTLTLGAAVVFSRWCEYRTEVARAKYKSHSTAYVYCCDHAQTQHLALTKEIETQS